MAAVCLHPTPKPPCQALLTDSIPTHVTEIDKAAVPPPLYIISPPPHPTPPTAVWAVTSCADQLTCKTSRLHGPRFSLNLIYLMYVSITHQVLETNLMPKNVIELNKKSYQLLINYENVNGKFDVGCKKVETSDQTTERLVFSPQLRS